MFELPETVMVGPLVYRVVKAPRLSDEQLYGRIIMTESAIEIHPTLDPELQRITLLHEVLHAIFAQYGIHEHDERIIDCVSHAIVLFAQDNPGVLA